MDSPAESGGRVTRALRKRLTSVDSDNGTSRPGTPVQSKLAAATTHSPLKPRMTRRNSTSGSGTPVKTPGKRAANVVVAPIAETEEANATPARRSTRRRSISQIENEATPKLDTKASKFEPVEEEQVTTRITRSKSKSPELTKTKPESTVVQLGRKSYQRSANMSQSSVGGAKDEVEKDKTDGETSVDSYKDGSNKLDSKVNKTNEIDVSNLSIHKQESLQTDANKDKKSLKELLEDTSSLHADDTLSGEILETKAEEKKTIASSQKRKSLSLRAAVESKKALEKIDENNSDHEMSEKTSLLPVNIEVTSKTLQTKSDEHESIPIFQKSKSLSSKTKLTVINDELDSDVEMLEDSSFLFTSVKVASTTPKTKDDENKTLASPQKSNSLSIMVRTVENNSSEEYDENDSDVEMYEDSFLLFPNIKGRVKSPETTTTEDNKAAEGKEEGNSNVDKKKDSLLLSDSANGTGEANGENKTLASSQKRKSLSPHKAKTTNDGAFNISEEINKDDEGVQQHINTEGDKALMLLKKDKSLSNRNKTVNDNAEEMNEEKNNGGDEMIVESTVVSAKNKTEEADEDKTIAPYQNRKSLSNRSKTTTDTAVNKEKNNGEGLMEYSTSNSKTEEAKTDEYNTPAPSQKRKSLSNRTKIETDNAVGKEKNYDYEMTEDSMLLSTVATLNSKTEEVKSDEDNTIAPSEKRKSLSINVTPADHKVMENNNYKEISKDYSPISISDKVPSVMQETNADEDTKFSSSSQKRKSLSAKSKTPDAKEVKNNDENNTDEDMSDDLLSLSAKKVDDDQSNESYHKRKSLSTKATVEGFTKMENNAKDKSMSPNKRKSFMSEKEEVIQMNISEVKDSEGKVSADLERVPSETVAVVEEKHLHKTIINEEKSKSPTNQSKLSLKDTNTKCDQKGDDQSFPEHEPTVVFKGNMKENVEEISPEKSGTPSPKRVDKSLKESCKMGFEDGKKIKTGTSSETISDSKDHDVSTPVRTASRVKPYACSDGGSLKTVGFSSNILQDEYEKSIYPKTPVSAKNKSIIEINDDSFDSQTDVNVHDISDIEIPETQQVNENHSITNDNTVISIADDTNITDAMEKIAELSESKVGDKTNDNLENSPEIILRWHNPSVVAKGSKLDDIRQEKEIVKQFDAITVNKKEKKHFLKRNEWNDDEQEEEDNDEEDDDEQEDEEEDEKYARKHPFLDSEVMVVDDYESGDSMDSEERREIEENEIPEDGESIGSHTTDGEDNDDYESENDSFIVSDNCEEGEIEEYSNSEDDEGVEESNVVECTKLESKQKYKRIQRISETSSSDEDKPNMENLEDTKDASEISDSDENLKVNKSVNSSRLSDSARRLHCDLGETSENSNNEDAIHVSRKEILHKLNQSDRFNKSVRDLNPEVDVSPDTLATTNVNNVNVTSVNVNEIKNTNGDESAKYVPDPEKEPIPTFTSVYKSDLNQSKKIDVNESHLGDESTTSAEESDNADIGNSSSSGNDGDAEKENKEEVKQKPKAKHIQGLSVSFNNFKQQKTEKSLQRKVLQRSFTIGVSVNGGALETEVIQNKFITPNAEPPSSSSLLASSSSNDDTDGDVLSSDDARNLENITHIPLGNPLVRTRRQSLALPTNPDMEIGTGQQHNGGGGYSFKNHKRKSLAVLSGNEFNPSQSFVDSLELRKAELQRKASKRKRLSKSFSGTTADNSVVDIDVRHLHKRSKIASEISFADSVENEKTDNSICLKAGRSSTPHEKVGAQKLNNSGVRRILNRCDEILEAANRAKLESKLNYQKSKVRLPKKNKKKMNRQTSAASMEANCDSESPTITKEMKRRDKAKIALAQSLKASANIIMAKQRKKTREQTSVAPNQLHQEILKSNATNTQATATKKRNEHLTEQNSKCWNYSTAAGNVVEIPLSPERKKKPKIIHLPTGTVCVEPLTPTKRSIVTCNGMKFAESPMTPCAVGFKVREALPLNENNCLNKERKRKRNEDGGKYSFATPLWTQSGLFIEEEIPSARLPHSICHELTSKRNHMGQQRSNNSNFNFKQSALLRGDIKRSSAREILQLRERRHMNDHY